jgi:hypothetical protein
LDIRTRKLLVILGFCATLAACGGSGSGSPAVAPAEDIVEEGEPGDDGGAVEEPADDAEVPAAVVTYTVHAGRTADIAFVGFRDGDGDWQAVVPTSAAADATTGGVEHVYALPVSATDLEFSAVVVCTLGTRFRGELIHALANRLQRRTIDCVDDRRTLAGSMTNYDAATPTTAYLGSAASALEPGAADYRISAPAPGRHALVGRDDSWRPHYYVNREVEVTPGRDLLPLIDFAYAEPVDPEFYELSVAPVPPYFECQLQSQLRVARTYVDMPLSALTGGGGRLNRSWQAMSAAQRTAEDRFRIGYTCGHVGAPEERTDERGATAFSREPSDARFGIPDSTYASLTMRDGRLRLSFSQYDGTQVAQAYQLHLDDRTSAERGVWNIRFDHAAVAHPTLRTVHFTFPDLSGLPGWQDRYYPLARNVEPYQYGTDHVSHFTSYASDGGNIWDLLEGYNNGIAPTAEGILYWGRHLYR